MQYITRAFFQIICGATITATRFIFFCTLPTSKGHNGSDLANDNSTLTFLCYSYYAYSYA